MGCVCSKHGKRNRERTISVVTNHMVALTSSTLGVLELDSCEDQKSKGGEDKSEQEKISGFCNNVDLTESSDAQKTVVMNKKWVEKTVIEEEGLKKAAELEPVTINAWELMEGLDDESVGESPAKIKSAEKNKKFVHKKTSFFHTVEEVDEKQQGLGKENARPAVDRDGSVLRSSGKLKMKEVSSPLREVNISNYGNKYSALKTPENVGFQKVLRDNSGGSLQVSRRVSDEYLTGGSVQISRRVSDGCMTDLKVAPTRRLNSKIRLSIDLITEPDSPLFSPHLVATLEKALENLSEEEWNAIRKAEGDHHSASFSTPNVKKKAKDEDPLANFEEKCPPGGANAVVLYTTTLRGIRKTFEDCNNVRDALESYGICISERDVSMHLEFRNELRKLMGKLVTVPRLFIKGRYIGGADEVLHIHEEGKLGQLLEGIPTDMAGKICDGCGGVRFVPCLECSGSCKLVDEENKVVRCPECNENGLIQCPICC